MTPIPVHGKTRVLAPLALTCLIGLGGCATTVATKDVVADSTQYMAEHFTPAQLSPAVRASVERGQTIPDRFKRMRVNYRIESEEEGRKQEATAAVDYTNLGNGYVQMRADLAKNAVPYRVNLALTFAGLYKLKTQTVFLGRSNALPPIDTKEMKRFDRGVANPVKGNTYTIDSMTGSAQQLANFIPEVFSCSAGDTHAASTIHPSLSGNAIALDCSLVGSNKVIVARHRLAWLVDYGVALEQGMADSRVNSTYTVQDVAVTR